MFCACICVRGFCKGLLLNSYAEVAARVSDLQPRLASKDHPRLHVPRSPPPSAVASNALSLSISTSFVLLHLVNFQFLIPIILASDADSDAEPFVVAAEVKRRPLGIEPRTPWS